MARPRNESIGEFITRISSNGNVANPEAVKALKAKLEAEEVAKMEKRILEIRDGIQSTLAMLRDVRRQEAGLLSNIKRLEAYANDILTGKARV
jgi:hypothetical protein